MRSMTVAIVFMAGCSLIKFRTPTTPAPMPDMTPLYPHEVSYELLGNVIGDACAFSLTPTDEVVESAKFQALRQAPSADGLMALRYKVETTIGKKCVTVIGRAYRILAIRARMPECETAAMVTEPAKPKPAPQDANPFSLPSWPK